jgi:pilus assembly protein CpaD
MKVNHSLLGAVLLLSLAACATQYTEAEAPKHLTLDEASAQIRVRFVPGSSRLAAADAVRLRALASTGRIASTDRIGLAVGGGPVLAAARYDTLSAELLPYGILVSPRPIAGVPANEAIIEAERYLVTTPPCPNWSKRAPIGFTNTLASNFGCATAVNLGRSVWSAADLVEGRHLATTDAIPAAAAVQRYEADKVTLPSATSLAGFAGATAGATGAGATGAGTAGTAP